MKPTQITDLIANIKHSFVSFFSILMFAALGVGVFLGISWASPALENAADNMFNEGSLHNYQKKKRELIVLMINGFGVKDARHYISYDNIVLTALGIIVGILLGILMGSITIASIEPVTGVYLKSADGIAIIAGILGSTILAIIMGAIALRRINKFDLTDINRF